VVDNVFQNKENIVIALPYYLFIEVKCLNKYNMALP